MIDLVIIAVVALIIGAAAFYLYRARKSGKRCIGCPYSGICSGGCSTAPDRCGQKASPSHIGVGENISQ